ncbi:MAG: PIN domain-containing protein [Gemmataceae bacterium]
MTDALADTHAAIWALFEPARLSAPGLQALQAAQAAGRRVLVSAITPIEVTYLAEKGRLAAPILPGLWTALSDPAIPFDILPASAEVARALDRIPRATLPDMPDRIIAATALAFGVPLVSADRKTRALSVPGLSVVW